MNIEEIRELLGEIKNCKHNKRRVYIIFMYIEIYRLIISDLDMLIPKDFYTRAMLTTVMK